MSSVRSRLLRPCHHVAWVASLSTGHCRSSVRRGISIIEVLLFITIAGAVMTSAMLCLDGLFRIQRQTSEAINVNRAVARLSDQMRDDVRHATAAEVVSADVGHGTFTLRLTVPDDELIVYQSEGEFLVRTMFQNGVVRRREYYHLGKRTAVDWQLTDSVPRIVTCVLRGSAAPDLPLEPQFHFEMMLGSAPARRLEAPRPDAVQRESERFEEEIVDIEASDGQAIGQQEVP